MRGTAKTTRAVRRTAALVSLVALIGGGVAAAEGATTRSDYVVQLEGICKPDALATQKAVKGVRGDIRADRLAVAARKFSKAARIFGGTVHTISAIARPPADGTKLAKWFAYLGKEELFLKKIAAALRAGHTIQSQRYTAHFIQNGNRANNVVLAFGFDYCSFKFSRFQ